MTTRKKSLIGTIVFFLASVSAGVIADEPATQPSAAPQITIDTTQTPELKEWVETNLRPVMEAWYPKIAAMLPSDGFTAPTSFSITFRTDKSGFVADTNGTKINVSAAWFKHHLHDDARGAIVHEMVHVVQQYGRGKQTNPHPNKNPLWLVEGMADYIRWYKYEPQSHGADKFDLKKAQYDGSYRPSSNFLNYVVMHYDKKLVVELNAQMRAGNYSDDLWKQYTGHTVEELGAEWKAQLTKSRG